MPVKKRPPSKPKKTRSTTSRLPMTSLYREAMMKILLALICVLLVYLIVYFGVLIQNGIREGRVITETEQGFRTVSIVGVGTVAKRYDASEATFGFTSRGETVLEVQRRADRLIESIVTQLTSIDIAAEDIRVVPYGVYPSESSSEEETPTTSFQMDLDIIVFLRDLALSDEIIELSTADHVQRFGGFVPRQSRPREAIIRARTEALRNARAQAQELSTVLGSSFVRVYSYSEENSEDTPELFEASFEETSVRVYITFEVR